MSSHSFSIAIITVWIGYRTIGKYMKYAKNEKRKIGKVIFTESNTSKHPELKTSDIQFTECLHNREEFI